MNVRAMQIAVGTSTKQRCCAYLKLVKRSQGVQSKRMGKVPPACETRQHPLVREGSDGTGADATGMGERAVLLLFPGATLSCHVCSRLLRRQPWLPKRPCLGQGEGGGMDDLLQNRATAAMKSLRSAISLALLPVAVGESRLLHGAVGGGRQGRDL